MKLYNYFLSLLAAAALAAGCMPEQVISSIPEFKPELSYLGIPYEGGVSSTPVKATAQWSFDEASIPDWLTVTPHSGGSEVNSIVFAAEKNTAASDRTANLLVNVAGKQQRFTVIPVGEELDEIIKGEIAVLGHGLHQQPDQRIDQEQTVNDQDQKGHSAPDVRPFFLPDHCHPSVTSF